LDRADPIRSEQRPDAGHERGLKVYRREFSADDITPVFVQSGELAYRLIQSESPPDVIVCDLLMPSVSGADLYEKALVEDASWRKRFIFTTGFSTVSHISSFVESVEARVFKKPLDMVELREAIRYAALTARIFTPRARGGQPARSL
jgi:DNA-binding NtrC family response regulator